MKTYKSNEELIEYLISKNVKITNKKDTLNKLSKYSYYSIINSYKNIFKNERRNFIMQLPYKIQILENEPLTTTNGSKEYAEQEEIPFHYVDDYLYHGIRFQTHLEKLESIFKSRKILAGKYIEGYRHYSDNCNKGEYVSLLKRKTTNNITYETFIEENISLLVTPLCDALETKYVDYNTWEQIQDHNIYHQLKNLYSYMLGECLCKDFIPIEMIKAIGVPYQRLIYFDKQEFADKLIEDIQILMKRYNIELPIVDTSRFNRILVDINENGKKRKLTNKLN